jgi:WD40 repeat protein
MRVAAAAALLLVIAGCGSGSGAIGRGDAKQLVELRRVRLGGQVLSVAWSPDGKRVAAGAPEGVALVDPTSARVRGFVRTDSQVWGVAWRRDGDVVAAATEDGRVRLSPGRVLEARFGAPAFSVSWSHDDRLAIGYSTGVVRVLGGDGRDRAPKVHDAEVIAVAWSHHGDRLASGSIDATVRVGSERFGEPNGEDVNGIAWSPDDKRIAAANQDGVVRIWDVERRKVVLRLRGHTGWTRGVDWSPNGELIATSGADATVRIWDGDDGKELRVLPAGRQETWAVAWSPDGKRLAAGDGDGTVRIWGLR